MTCREPIAVELNQAIDAESARLIGPGFDPEEPVTVKQIWADKDAFIKGELLVRGVVDGPPRKAAYLVFDELTHSKISEIAVKNMLRIEIYCGRFVVADSDGKFPPLDFRTLQKVSG